MKTKIIILILLLTAIQINGEIRFVSKSGSSTEPYTSWVTAADSIQKVVNMCNYGDTIYVASGSYNEYIVLGNGISLIGSGMDSCFLDTRKIATETDWYVIWINGDAAVSGFTIMASRYLHGSTGIAIFGPNNHSKIENNKIQNDATGVIISGNNALIKSNIIISGDRGMHISHYDSECYPVIENNYIASEAMGIYIMMHTCTTIKNNYFYINSGKSTSAIQTGTFDSLWVYNNIVIGVKAFEGIGHTNYPAVVHNNLLYGVFYNWSILSYSNYGNVKNNLSMNKINGIGTTYEGGGKKIRYNNSWGGVKNYYYFIPDSTNLSVDPMIVSDDSSQFDFHLQKYSPMIDAGDPDIKDVDGSRSDIGVYGGPFGESYTYKDLAPREPRNITGVLNKGKITLNWQKNTEADFAYYRIYRDTVSTVIKDTSKRYVKLTDTVFTDYSVPGKNYYYRLSAADNQGNESILSEEAEIITGVKEKPGVNLQDYILYQNYPNPFNPSTKIGYRLLKPGHVRIAVYDIKGAIVRELENSYCNAGYYETEFTGQKGEWIKDAVERLASGVYLCRIEIKNENNIPVFMDMKKMLMLK